MLTAATVSEWIMKWKGCGRKRLWQSLRRWPAFAGDWIKPRKTPVKISCFRTEFWTHNLMNKEQSCHLYCDVRPDTLKVGLIRYSSNGQEINFIKLFKTRVQVHGLWQLVSLSTRTVSRYGSSAALAAIPVSRESNSTRISSVYYS